MSPTSEQFQAFLAMEHDGPVIGAVFDKAEKRILTWGRDGTARLWDAYTGDQIGQPMEHQSDVPGMSIDQPHHLLGTPFVSQNPVNGAVFDQIARKTVGACEVNVVCANPCLPGDRDSQRNRSPTMVTLPVGIESAIATATRLLVGSSKNSRSTPMIMERL